MSVSSVVEHTLKLPPSSTRCTLTGHQPPRHQSCASSPTCSSVVHALGGPGGGTMRRSERTSNVPIASCSYRSHTVPSPRPTTAARLHEPRSPSDSSMSSTCAPWAATPCEAAGASTPSSCGACNSPSLSAASLVASSTSATPFPASVLASDAASASAPSAIARRRERTSSARPSASAAAYNCDTAARAVPLSCRNFSAMSAPCRSAKWSGCSPPPSWACCLAAASAPPRARASAPCAAASTCLALEATDRSRAASLATRLETASSLPTRARVRPRASFEISNRARLQAPVKA